MISIVITNWNGKELLAECLPSVIRAVKFDKENDYEIIVVDDCSSDTSVEFVRENFKEVKVVRPPQNLGFQGAANLGVRAAKAEIVVILNNDIKLREDCLRPLFTHFKDGQIFAVSSKAYGWDEKTFLYGRRGASFKAGHFNIYNNEETNEVCDTSFVTGGAAAFDREKFLGLGGYDQMFHPLYYEDVDICYRAWKRGWRSVYEPESVVYHKHQATITTQYKKREIGYISARNNYLFTWKNITDLPLTLSHLLFAPLFLIRDLFKGKLRFWIAILNALPRLPRAIESRLKERPYQRVKDRDLLKLIG
ncbi:glycosyltransferase family 2 protein [bacterium]|nr:glycosyltransferase family 2 protein [bacterium]